MAPARACQVSTFFFNLRNGYFNVSISSGTVVWLKRLVGIISKLLDTFSINIGERFVLFYRGSASFREFNGGP